jgi:hypothetical protein
MRVVRRIQIYQQFIKDISINQPFLCRNSSTGMIGLSGTGGNIHKK